MYTIDILMILASVVFTVLIILLNVRFDTNEGIFILSTVIAFSTVITQFILLSLLPVEDRNSVHVIVLLVYFGIILFQIHRKFSFQKKRNVRNQKKFIERRK